MQYLKYFAHRHDQLPAFHATYLVLTVLAASLFPLGAFGLLIIAHMSLDCVKYREHHRYTWNRTGIAMLRESLVDITLFMLGLLFAVYLHHSLPGIAALSGLYRSEVTLLRAFGTLIPKMKILYDFLAVLSNLHHYLHHVPTYVKKGWDPVEYVSLFSLPIIVVLLLLAPSVLSLDATHFAVILRSELIPWNI